MSDGWGFKKGKEVGQGKLRVRLNWGLVVLVVTFLLGVVTIIIAKVVS